MNTIFTPSRAIFLGASLIFTKLENIEPFHVYNIMCYA